MSILNKGMITVLALVVVIIFGFLLSRNGKPYSDLLFTIHKLVALAMIIYSFLYIKEHTAIIKNNTWLIILLVLVIICIIALFTTGALLSIGKVDYEVLKRLHLPLALILSISVISFLLVLLPKIKM